MYGNLLLHIRKYVSLDDEEERVLLSYLSYREVPKKGHILKSGQICNANYFVIKGCFRMYLSTSTGEEQIVQFGIDNWWITDYTSLDSRKHSHFSIQAIENSKIAVIEKQIQEELFGKIPQLERYFRLILQRAHAASLMRLHYIFNQSGEERYHHIASAFPEFVQRVPQYMLASYLGFTPEFLSKIRARKG